MDAQSFLAGTSVPSQTQQNQRPLGMHPPPCAMAQTRFIRHTGRRASLSLGLSEPRRCGGSVGAIGIEVLANSCLLCDKPMTHLGGYGLVSSRSIFEPAN